MHWHPQLNPIHFQGFRLSAHVKTHRLNGQIEALVLFLQYQTIILVASLLTHISLFIPLNKAFFNLQLTDVRNATSCLQFPSHQPNNSAVVIIVTNSSNALHQPKWTRDERESTNWKEKGRQRQNDKLILYWHQDYYS